MKKIIKFTFLMAILFLLSACGPKKEEPKDDDQPKTPIEEAVDNETIIKQGDIELRNVKISASGSINTVTATIKNVGSTTKTFDAVLYMKNEQNQILGKVDTHVDDLGPSKSKDISVEIMGDYTTVKTYQLVVENLSEK